MVTRQLQVERKTGKVRRPKTDVLPLCHASIAEKAVVILPEYVNDDNDDDDDEVDNEK